MEGQGEAVSYEEGEFIPQPHAEAVPPWNPPAKAAFGLRFAEGVIEFADIPSSPVWR
jgi:hypothetical protein